jgi:hypothetical protein
MSEFFSKLFPLLLVSHNNFVIDQKLHHIAFLNILVNLIILGSFVPSSTQLFALFRPPLSNLVFPYIEVLNFLHHEKLLDFSIH